jgi:LacI family transcriptional regulator
MIPRKQSLVHQVASILRDGVRDAIWTEWLPGERVLCENYKVSRNTLRAAIDRLASEGVLIAVHGTGTRIVGKPRTENEVSREGVVGIISSRTIERVRPSTAIWVDELRERLFEAGLLLRIHLGRQFYQGDPSHSLESLLKRHPASCWLLQQSTGSMQEWFATNRIPCVVAGSAYDGVAVPSVDLDYRVLCRHAVGSMIGQGHRRVCMITPESKCQGDMEGEAGFWEGIEMSHHRDVESTLIRHGNDKKEIRLAVDKVLTQKVRPTAILVGRSFVYLTLVSRMAQLGLKIPGNISVVCREADPFLKFLTPRPTHYYINPIAYAGKLLDALLGTIEGDIGKELQTLILPELEIGMSLAPPPKVSAA